MKDSLQGPLLSISCTWDLLFGACCLANLLTLLTAVPSETPLLWLLCRWMVALTAFQAAYLGMVYGITWAWIVGVIFPVPILLLVPIRQFIMPRVCVHVHSQDRDRGLLLLMPPAHGQLQQLSMAACVTVCCKPSLRHGSHCTHLLCQWCIPRAGA